MSKKEVKYHSAILLPCLYCDESAFSPSSVYRFVDGEYVRFFQLSCRGCKYRTPRKLSLEAAIRAHNEAVSFVKIGRKHAETHQPTKD